MTLPQSAIPDTAALAILRGRPRQKAESPWPSKPEAAFYGLAGGVVSVIEPHTESDPVALLAQFLVAFGNAVKRTAHVRVEADRHFANLFGVLVGRSSKGRKGTSLGYVRGLFERVDPEWVSGCWASGLSSGEGLIWAVRDRIERLKTNQKGESATLIEDAGVSDKRLLVIEPEFASVLRVMERDGSTLSAVQRQAWDTGDLRSLTKNSPNKATGAHISSIGHITQDELLRYWTRTESANGYANRILWLLVRRSKFLPFGGNLDESRLTPYVERLRRAVETARTRDTIYIDEGARKMWAAAYPSLTADRPGMFGAVTGRAEAQTLRVSLLYALLDQDEMIREPHLRAALALWQYCQESCRIIFGDSLGDPKVDTILRALRTHPEGMTRTAVSRDLFSGNIDKAELDRALGVLVEHGHAYCVPGEGSRAAETWYANVTNSTNSTKSGDSNSSNSSDSYPDQSTSQEWDAV